MIFPAWDFNRGLWLMRRNFGLKHGILGLQGFRQVYDYVQVQVLLCARVICSYACRSLEEGNVGPQNNSRQIFTCTVKLLQKKNKFFDFPSLTCLASASSISWWSSTRDLRTCCQLTPHLNSFVFIIPISFSSSLHNE